MYLRSSAVVALLAALVLPWSPLAAQTATGGGWSLKPENYVGYLTVYTLDNVSLNIGKGDDFATYPPETNFLVRFDMQLPTPSSSRVNQGLAPSPQVCSRMAAEIFKNKLSLMRNRFIRATKQSKWLKTVFPAPLKAHILRERPKHMPQFVEVSLDGIADTSVLCFVTVEPNNNLQTKIEAWVAFKP